MKRQKVLFIALVFMMFLSAFNTYTYADSNEYSSVNKTSSGFEYVSITRAIKGQVKANSVDRTTIDVTFLAMGDDVGHEHVYETKYDSNNHWKQCIICDKKIDISGHSYTEAWSMGDSCAYGNKLVHSCSCGYSYRTENTRPHRDLRACYFETNTYHLVNQCAYCKDAYGARSEIHYDAGGQLGCATGRSGTCSACGVEISADMHEAWMHPDVTNGNHSEEHGQLATCSKCGKNLATDFVGDISYNGTTMTYTLKVTYPWNISQAQSFSAGAGFYPDQSGIVSSSSYSVSGKTVTYNITAQMAPEYEKRTVLYYNPTVTTADGTRFTIHQDTWVIAEKTPPQNITVNQQDITSQDGWATAKRITIAGTENYCSSVNIKVKDSSGREYANTKTVVNNGSFSYSFIPDIEADENGVALVAEISDALGNTTTKNFTVYKIDNYAPTISGDLNVSSGWSKSKDATYLAIDNGVKDVQISFNDETDYKLANEVTSNTFSRDYTFVGDVYGVAVTRVYAKDKLGNSKTEYVKIGYLDNTAPTVTNATKSIVSSGTTRSVDITATAHDRNETLNAEGSGVSKYMITTNTNRPTESDLSWQDSNVFNVTQNGTYYLWAMDAVGNISNYKEVVVNEICTVTSRYIDLNHPEIVLADPVVTYGTMGENYTTSAKTIEGYKLDATPENATGIINNETVDVTYYYRKKSKVTINYLDTAGTKLTSSIVLDGAEGEPYTSELKTFNGYFSQGAPYNANGNFEAEDLVVNYVYDRELTTEPNVSINKEAEWKDIEEGIAKITLTQTETVEEKVDNSDYLIIFDVSGSMPIVTVNNYEPGTHNVNVNEVVNIGCKNPNHYSQLRPGQADDMEGRRNCDHYDRTTGRKLNYTASQYKQTNWKGDVVQTFNMSGPKDFMYSKANGCYSSMDVAQHMINDFVDETLKVDPNARFAYISFGGSVVKTNDFTTGANLKNLVNNSTQYVGTRYLPPLQKAEEVLSRYNGNKPLKILFITDGDNYEESGISSQVVAQASRLKSRFGAQIYSVTIDYNAPATADVRKISDKFVSLTSANVDATVEEFVNYSLNRQQVRATNKVYTDEISDYYEVVNAAPYALPTNVTASGSTVTWNIPVNNTTDTTTYTTSFYVKLKDQYRKTATDTKYATNKDTASSKGANLNYKISGGVYNGQSRTKSKETPLLPYGLKVVDMTKTWNDYENAFDLRPETIKYNLLKDNTQVDTATISEYTHTFPGYKTDNTGKLVVYGLLYNNASQKVTNTYKVTEDAVTYYDTIQIGEETNSYTVLNKINRTGDLKVRYVDREGNDLLPEENSTKLIGTNYSTSRKPIEGYKAYGNEPANAIGIYDLDPITVTYVYDKIQGLIEVDHIDLKTGKSLAKDSYSGSVGDSVTTSSKDIEGYVLKISPNTEEYTITEETQYVNYYYVKLSDVVTRYVDENHQGTELAQRKTDTYEQDNTYTTIKESIDGYTFTRDSGNTTGTVGAEDIEVVYYYKKNAKVTAKYVYKDDPTIELEEQEVINGLEGDPYQTTEKTISGFVLDHVDGNTNSTLGTEDTVVTYYYDLVRVKISIDKKIEATTSTSQEQLNGAEFTLTVNSLPGKVELVNPGNTFVSRSLGNGNYVIENVPYGNYSLTETTIPNIAYGGNFYVDGSTQRVNTHNIVVQGEQNLSYTLENVAKKMNITVNKEDTENGANPQGDATLEGAVYGVYSDEICSNKVDQITIAKEGSLYTGTSQGLRVGTYYVKEITPSAGYLIDETVYKVEQNPDRQTTEFSYHNITSKERVIRNNIDIKKYIDETDSSNKKTLSGAVFTATLKSDESKTYTSDPTDAEGNTTIRNLPYGTYVVRETTVPETAYNGEFYVYGGERINEFEHEIVVDSSNGTYEYKDITDVPKKMNITIYKEDSVTGKDAQGNASLDGAVYGIYRDSSCTNEVERIAISQNADGTHSATTGWYLVGTYYIKEISASTGYKIDTTVYTVEQSASEQTTEYKSFNITSQEEVVKNDIELTKYVGETVSSPKQTASGAVFVAILKSDETKQYVSAATDENGHTIIKDVPYGVYRITETVAPESAYGTDFSVNGSPITDSFELEVRLDKGVQPPYVYNDITNPPKKMKITVFKQDEETGNTPFGDLMLDGATYGIYRDSECTDEVQRLIISQNPDGSHSATSDELLTGTYYVKEISAPFGYTIDSTVYTVAQDASIQDVEVVEKSVTSLESGAKGSIEIYKYLEATATSSKQPMAGVEFTATLNSDTTKQYKATTNNTGYCVISNLPYGIYTVTETIIPSTAYDGQFMVNGSTAKVKTISASIEVGDESTRIVSYSDITNVAKKMNITIVKEDSETGNNVQGDATLEGAMYGIYKDAACTQKIEDVLPVKQADGSYSAKVEGYLVGTYYVKELKAPTGYNIDTTVHKVSQNPVEQTTEFSEHRVVSKEDVIRNDIEIYKYLEPTVTTPKQPLANVEFTATLNSDTTKTYSATTDERGYAVIENLPYGKYTLTETIIPDSAYDGEFTVGDSTLRVKTISQNISVDKNKTQVYSYSDITNIAKKMNITIFKEDSKTGNTPQGSAKLDNAVYGIYKDDTCTDLIEELTIKSNPDGTHSATSGWYLTGTYYVKELRASNGYNIDENIYAVAQNPATQTTEYVETSVTSKEAVITNDVELYKYLDATDSTEKQPLAGVTFKATSKVDSSKTYSSTQTDANGYAIIRNLPYGEYVITEESKPNIVLDNGFTYNGRQNLTELEVNITEDKQSTQAYTYRDIVNTPKKMSITITKEDSKTQNTSQGDATLEGAVYGIYRDNNCTDEIEKITIARQNDGKYSAVSGEYLSGTYYVKEITPSNGYKLDTTTYTVTQDVSAQTEGKVDVNVTSKEDVIENDILITKKIGATDYTEKELLEGCGFTATLKSNPEVKYVSKLTDENGQTTLENLPYGEYEIEETTVSSKTLKMDNFSINITKDKTEKNGYTPSDAGVRTVDETGAIVQTPKVMTIKIRKVDANRTQSNFPDYTQGDAKLNGAIYQVFRFNESTSNYDELVTEITVNAKDDDGYYYAKTNELPVGNYMVKEKVKMTVEENGKTYKYSYATGYLVDENEYLFEQNPSSQTERLKEFSDESKEEVVRGSIDVINLNDTTSATTEGIVLKLTLDSNPDVNFEVSLDNEGNAEFIENGRDEYIPHTIPYGKYTITEIKESKFKKHLDIKENPVDINIQTQDQEEHIYYSEEPIQAFLKIQKVDKETNKNVLKAGAKIKLWDMSKDEFVTQNGTDEFVTDENGTISISRNFETGEYIVYEIKAPEGYYLEEAYRLPENPSDYGKVDKGGKHITITSADLELEESAADEEVKIYYNVEIEDEPLKANIEIEKLGEGLIGARQSTTAFGEKYTPIYSNVAIEGVTYDIYAKEDIKSLDGTITYATSGERVDSVTTNVNGIATSVDLYPGTYEVKEVSCPEGYILDTTSNIVVLSNNDELVRVKTTKESYTDPRQKLSLTFNKEFVENEYKNGNETNPTATFKVCAAEDIRNSNGTIAIPRNAIVDIISVNGNGTLTSYNLPQGKYYTEEVNVSYPYKVSSQRQEYNLVVDNSNNQEVVFEGNKVINYPVLSNAIVLKISSVKENNITLTGNEMSAEQINKGQIISNISGKNKEEIKTYLDSNEIISLAGAKYALFSDSACTKQVEMKVNGEYSPVEYTTDENGIIEIKDIPVATYFLKETEAPAGYKLSNEVVKVEIKENETNVAVATDDLELKELIIKTDNVSRKPVENAKFEIKDESGKLVVTTTTDKDGIAYVPAGLFSNNNTYTYTEIEAPDIYDITDEETEFIATFNTLNKWTTQIQNVVNKRGTVTLTINKMDDEKKPVENCKFELVNNETGEVLETVTNKDGVAEFKDLYKGWYTYREVSTPEGYILNTQEYKITLMEDKEVEFINNKLIIPTIDVQTGDIAVISVISIAAISIVGIIYITKRRRELNS